MTKHGDPVQFFLSRTALGSASKEHQAPADVTQAAHTESENEAGTGTHAGTRPRRRNCERSSQKAIEVLASSAMYSCYRHFPTDPAARSATRSS